MNGTITGLKKSIAKGAANKARTAQVHAEISRMESDLATKQAGEITQLSIDLLDIDESDPIPNRVEMENNLYPENIKPIHVSKAKKRMVETLIDSGVQGKETSEGK